MSAAEARRKDTLPSSIEERLRGQANPQDRSESSSQSLAVKALDVAVRQSSPSAAEADVCVLCLDPMDGPKESLFELGCRYQYHRVCVYNLLKDGKYRSCPLCQTKIPAELQERAMTFVMKRLHKRTTVDLRNKPAQGRVRRLSVRRTLDLGAILQDPNMSDLQVRQLLQVLQNTSVAQQ